MDVQAIEWGSIVARLWSIAVAFVLAIPVAWDREQSERSAGLRTFPLVATAACGYVLLARAVFPDGHEAQARILEGLISGIGFIGGGAILKERGSVRGTATAASIWATAATGAAVAYDRYDIALVLSLTNVATLRLLGPLKSEHP